MAPEAGIGSIASSTQQDRIESPRWPHVALLAAAVIGWVTFIVACVGGPAWSPDGSKILFGYYDEQSNRVLIALHDVSKHKTTNVFAAPALEADDNGVVGMVPAWQADGSRALIAVTSNIPGNSDLHCTLISISTKSNDPPQLYDFGKSAVCWSAGMIVQLGNSVYLSGDDGLVSLDLATGKLEAHNIPGSAQYIAEHNGKLVYVRGISRPAPTPENKDAVDNGLELGQVDLNDFQLKPFYSLWKADFADIDALRDAFGGSWEPGGTRIAMIAEGDDFDTIVLLDEQKKILKTFVPDLGAEKSHLGMPVWSRDGKLLYVPVLIPAGKEKDYTYSLAKIPVDGTRPRLTAITRLHWEKSDDLSGTLTLGLQFSLSPDGKTIAATTASLGKGVAPYDRVLFLIDAQHPDHRIKRISPPRNEKTH